MSHIAGFSTIVTHADSFTYKTIPLISWFVKTMPAWPQAECIALLWPCLVLPGDNVQYVCTCGPGQKIPDRQRALCRVWAPSTHWFLVKHGNPFRQYTSYIIIKWMRSSLVVRASDCQCRTHNSPGFDPSILRYSVIWGAADEAVHQYIEKKPWLKALNKVYSTHLK